MKYLILGIALLALVLGISLTTALCSAERIDALRQPLTEAAPLLMQGEAEAARPLIEQAAQRWEEEYDRFSCLLDHEKVDGINCAFARLRAFLAADEPAEFCAAYAELQAMLRRLRGIDLPYGYNLL